MKKIIPVLIAILLILGIGAACFGKTLWEKYSYGKELADLDEYYQLTEEGRLAIILQDEMVEEQAVLKDGAVYFDLAVVQKYLNEGFYVDRNEQKLLYTSAVDTATALFGEKAYTDGAGGGQTEYVICYLEGDALYIAADYVRKFTNYDYIRYDRHLQVYTEWGVRQTMEVERDTQVRTLGGIKSPILRQLENGEKVELLEQMETWSLVKTSDSVIGYVENKRLGNLSSEVETPVTDYVAPEYTSISMEGKVSLGWHAIWSQGGGSANLGEVLAEGKGMNVIAPTWFSLTDSMGGFRSLAETAYVERAHGSGLQVWGVWDNFNYAADTPGAQVDTFAVLSHSSIRQQLAQSIADTSLQYGLDGVNIDFEGLDEKCGVHYIQFLRELSVLCRKSGLVLSVDNYVPFDFNDYYRLDIQGEILDYVIIMGYDEHWHGSQNPGSVASIKYVSDGLTRTLEEVPAQKVVNALPFYTILWKTKGAEVTDEYITLNNVDGFLERRGMNPQWDETTCQNYLEWESDGTRYQIWIEDVESLSVKLNVMNAQDIGGVAVWRLGYGTPEAWALIQNYVNF